jgi:hypothetical protein
LASITALSVAPLDASSIFPTILTQFYMTAEAVEQCEHLYRPHPVAQRRLAATLFETSATHFQPDPFLVSTSTSRRPLLLDFSRCWATQSIHGPPASLSFSLN